MPINTYGVIEYKKNDLCWVAFGNTKLKLDANPRLVKMMGYSGGFYPNLKQMRLHNPRGIPKGFTMEEAIGKHAKDISYVDKNELNKYIAKFIDSYAFSTIHSHEQWLAVKSMMKTLEDEGFETRLIYWFEEKGEY